MLLAILTWKTRLLLYWEDPSDSPKQSVPKQLPTGFMNTRRLKGLGIDSDVTIDGGYTHSIL